MEHDQLCPPTYQDDPVLLTAGRTARRLDTSERHVRRLVASGRLPAVKLGGKVRIRPDDLETYVNDLPERARPTAPGDESDGTTSDHPVRDPVVHNPPLRPGPRSGSDGSWP